MEDSSARRPQRLVIGDGRAAHAKPGVGLAQQKEVKEDKETLQQLVHRSFRGQMCEAILCWFLGSEIIDPGPPGLCWLMLSHGDVNKMHYRRSLDMRFIWQDPGGAN